MAGTFSRISTIVRSCSRLAWLRLQFGIGGLLQPLATTRRAGMLFCTPLASTRSRALESLPIDAVESNFVVDGERIHTYVWGDPKTQPYVLLAHGWSSHGTRFLPWIDALRGAGYAVVTFDQAAHGLSSGNRNHLPGFVSTLQAVATRFGPAAALVGHSLGGAASAVALARGLPADRAVLIAPAADPMDAAMRFARLVGLPAGLGKRMMAMFESTVGEPFSEYAAQSSAPRIARPALIVHDLDDREVPWAEGERYARYWRDSRLVSTHGLGHNRIAQDPGVIEAALRFLRGERIGDRIVSSPNLPYGVC